MQNSEYWEKRIAEEVWKTYNSLEDRNKELLNIYKKAYEDIQKELYILSQKIGSTEPTRSELYKYNRLNNLNKNIKDRIKTLGEDVLSFGLDNMADGYKTVYAEIMAALNVKDFTIPDEKLIKQIADSPWKTKFQNGESTFSKSLWKDTNKLNKCINNVLSAGIVQGKTFTEMAIQINNEMNKGFNVAHRLVRTETMHTLNMSSLNSYKDSGVVKEVQYWAALDERTCEICGIMHGNTYKINEAPILPIHVNCRCTYIPVINKEETKKEKIVNANGDEIKFNFKDIDKKANVVKIIKILTSQYNTRLISVNQGGAGKAAGLTDVAGNIWLNNSQNSTIIHEFSHSIAQTATDTLKITNNKEFWKEIKKLRREYIKVIEKDPSKIISFYSKSEKDKYDEFMAEAFTQIKLSEMNIIDENYGKDLTYAKKVLAVIDKYFKK